jgi:transcriptional regulator with XRE-family HTH domain
MNVYHVYELSEISNLTMVSYPGFGNTSLEELKNCLFKLIEDIPSKFEDLKNINSFFESAVNSIKDNEKIVFTLRLGYSGDYKTLAETAEQLGVTRQRVEQIERKLGLNLDKIYNIKEFLYNKLDKLLEKRFIPLQVSAIKNYDPWFGGLDERPWILERILMFFKISEFSVSDYKNLKILHRGPKEFIDSTIQDLFKWVDKNRESRLTLATIKDNVGARIKFVAPELFDLILTEITGKMKFITVGEDQVLIALGNSLDTSLISIIEQSSAPLNITEIQKLLNEESVNSGERYVRAACAKLFLLFGPSLFGLRKHLNFNELEILTIANSVEEIVHDNNFPRQWHCDKVMEILEKNNFIFLSRLNKYKLSLCLQLSNKFEFLGRLTFTSKSEDKDSKQNRLEFFPMVEFILEQSEKPLHTDDIKALIEKDRGLGTYSQITTRGRLVSFEEGIWGLIDKHANVSHEDFIIIVNELTNIFLENKKGISENEMLGYITSNMYINRFKSNTYLLYSLAQKSELFKRDREFLYLLEIDAPKRLSKVKALEAIIKKIGDSFRTEDLYKQASELYGEEISYERVSLAIMVAKYNYVYDREKKLYKKGSNVN